MVITPTPEAATGNSKLAANATGPFINEREILRRIPISRRTCWAYRKSGKLPHIVCGGRILYHWPSVEAQLLRFQKGAA